MPRVVKLSVVRSDRSAAAAKEIRREVFKRVNDIVRDAGDNLSGFAFVAWDKDGRNYSTFQSGSPFMSRMIPSFAHDSLNQHVAVDITKDELK